jgi:hypothetical protein
MKCSKCGAQINETEETCSACRQESPVRVLTRAERDDFTGETIDTSLTGGFENSNNHNSQYEYRRYDNPNYSSRIYKFNLFPTTFWGKAAAVLIVGLLFFIALPLFFLAILIGLIISMFFFKRR